MDNVVLITGASSGIGKAAAKKLLNEDMIVYGAARRVEKMSDLKDSGINIIKMDLTEDPTMVEGVNKIIDEHGRIDVLINNAGYGSYGALEDVSIEEAKRQFEVNVFGLARLTQLVMPYMRKNRSGKIINISSMGGKIYTPMGAWYHATKFALEGLSDCLRFEAKPFGIDVIVIEPGAIKTEWGDIACSGLLETSGDTAYSGIASKVVKLFKKSYNDPKASAPEVIAEAISKAINAKKPKTRYAEGRNAKAFLFIRRILSDKQFDKMIEATLK